jgi:DNA-directed RNA polymerase specialized sigma24 family protein
MKKKYMKMLSKKHNDWIEICKSFGLDEPTSKDLVQEMYIEIYLKIENDKLDISYNEEINYYYIFKTLRSMFIDLYRKKKRVTIVRNLTEYKRADTYIDYETKYIEIQKELDKMYWYNKKVFEIVNSGTSIAELSRKSGIPYYSLYNTYKKVKEILKKKL